jgi:hypothetical protein
MARRLCDARAETVPLPEAASSNSTAAVDAKLLAKPKILKTKNPPPCLVTGFGLVYGETSLLRRPRGRHHVVWMAILEADALATERLEEQRSVQVWQLTVTHLGVVVAGAGAEIPIHIIGHST